MTMQVLILLRRALLDFFARCSHTEMVMSLEELDVALMILLTSSLV
jgi:hypothetical protein